MEDDFMKKIFSVLVKHLPMFAMGLLSYAAWIYTIYKGLTGNSIWFYVTMAIITSGTSIWISLVDKDDLIEDVENLNKEEA